jgi:hypothetical protein
LHSLSFTLYVFLFSVFLLYGHSLQTHYWHCTSIFSCFAVADSSCFWLKEKHSPISYIEPTTNFVGWLIHFRSPLICSQFQLYCMCWAIVISIAITITIVYHMFISFHFPLTLFYCHLTV